jgi:hypothetical protein
MLSFGNQGVMNMLRQKQKPGEFIKFTPKELNIISTEQASQQINYGYFITS